MKKIVELHRPAGGWNGMELDGTNWREVSRGCADAGHVMMTVVVMLLSEKRGQWIVD